MIFHRLVGLFSLVLSLQLIPSVHAGEINRDLEASALSPSTSHHYAIHLLQPLPRRNSGCETIFRNGKVLDSCDPNYGLDPEIDGVFRTYCEWNLNSHYQKNNSAHWLEPYFNPNLISISDAKVGYHLTGKYSTIWRELGGSEKIFLRWVELDFNDQISGSKLGALKCYPSIYGLSSQLAGSKYYDHHLSENENRQNIKSGISIGKILDQLQGYVELIQTN